jgi:eukaryotic-like serine/threonine-protein kinase
MLRVITKKVEEEFMLKICLPRGIWYYNPQKQLGPAGGFGVVFYGEDKDKNEVAVKKLEVDANEAGHRELRIADDFAKHDFINIIPIFDSGQDSESDSYFIIMALAEKSLQDDLNKGIQYNDIETRNILLSIILGLQEVPNIVHRDLKPGNILFHQNKWKIADFGIARFVEESTSLRTLKNFLSYPYAAPEQWNYEHPTKQTDIYALGCIGYILLTGAPPFNGPKMEDFREQHLYSLPKKIENHNNLLCSLLTMMLRKNSDARPTLDRVKLQLDKIAEDINLNSSSSAIIDLQVIGNTDAEKNSKKEAEKKLKESQQEKRLALADEAWQILKNIINHLFNIIEENTQTAIKSEDVLNSNLRKPSYIKLGQAELLIDYLIELGLAYENRFTKSGWDVLAGVTIIVSQAKPNNKWGASLWYMRRHPNNDYRWYEVSYMSTPFTKNPPSYEPFELKNVMYADEAAAPIMSIYQLAHEPELIDDENEEEFLERWLKRFVLAYNGQLQHPSHLPY